MSLVRKCTQTRDGEKRDGSVTHHERISSAPKTSFPTPHTYTPDFSLPQNKVDARTHTHKETKKDEFSGDSSVCKNGHVAGGGGVGDDGDGGRGHDGGRSRCAKKLAGMVIGKVREKVLDLGA